MWSNHSRQLSDIHQEISQSKDCTIAYLRLKGVGVSKVFSRFAVWSECVCKWFIEKFWSEKYCER